MKTAVIHVIGRIQKVGYRTRVIGYAHSLNVNGYVRNLPDGRVEIVAQAPEEILKIFIDNINIQDPLIYIDDIKTKYTDEFEGFTDFHKIVGPNETDARLDDGIKYLKQIANTLEKMTNKMDHNHTELIREIQEGNQEIVSEIHALREDNNERVINEIHEVKTLLKMHLKQS